MNRKLIAAAGVAVALGLAGAGYVATNYAFSRYSNSPQPSSTQEESISEDGFVVNGHVNERICGKGQSLFTIVLQESRREIALCNKFTDPEHYVGTKHHIIAVPVLDSHGQHLRVNIKDSYYLSRSQFWVNGQNIYVETDRKYPLYDYDYSFSSQIRELWLLLTVVGAIVTYVGIDIILLREKNRRYFFSSALEHVEERSGSGQKKELDEIAGLTRVYHLQEEGRHITHDGREVEVTSLGDPYCLNFHWSNYLADEKMVVAKNIFNDATAQDGNAFMLAETQWVHRNNIYGYAVVRAREIPQVKLEGRVSAYQLRPDGQLVPQSSAQQQSVVV